MHDVIHVFPPLRSFWGEVRHSDRFKNRKTHILLLSSHSVSLPFMIFRLNVAFKNVFCQYKLVVDHNLFLRMLNRSTVVWQEACNESAMVTKKCLYRYSLFHHNSVVTVKTNKRENDEKCEKLKTLSRSVTGQLTPNHLTPESTHPIFGQLTLYMKQEGPEGPGTLT